MEARKIDEASLEQAVYELETRGYSRVAGLLDDDDIQTALQELQHLKQSYPVSEIENTPRLDAGQEVVYNLQNKSLFLTRLVLGNGFISKLLCYFLNDQWHQAIPLDKPNYILRSFLARNNVVETPMHIDSYIPYQGDYPLSIQVSIILEDQTAENGATMVVPGSHQSGRYVEQSDRDKALYIESKSGDVVLWDSRIWHGTGVNHSSESRWSLIATFVRWWIKQGYQITEHLPADIYRELTEEQRAVLGYCSVPFRDEFEGIDFKTGFDKLPEK